MLGGIGLTSGVVSSDDREIGGDEASRMGSAVDVLLTGIERDIHRRL